jgi:hypothetical protein
MAKLIQQSKSTSRRKDAIELSPAMEIKPAKKKIGRPRKYVGGFSAAAYKGRRGRSKPQCINRGCTAFLRVDQLAVCSDACRNEVFRRAMKHLRWIDASREEILDYFDNVEDEPITATAQPLHC